MHSGLIGIVCDRDLGPAGAFAPRAKRISGLKIRSIRIGGLHLLWFGRRRLNRLLRVGWQDPRVRGANVCSRGGMLRLFGGFDFWRIPSVASLNPQHDYADESDGDRNGHQWSSIDMGTFVQIACPD